MSGLFNALILMFCIMMLGIMENQSVQRNKFSIESAKKTQQILLENQRRILEACTHEH